jgi:hypothetical protein
MSTIKLQAGTIDTEGVLSDGSMAKAIDDALATLVPRGPAEDRHGRAKLALAIARGVVGHLDAMEGALFVELPRPQGPPQVLPVRVVTE